MVRSVRVADHCIEKVKSALARNGFPTQGHLASELEIGLSTINKFFNGKPVYFSKCEDICDRLGLQWQEIIDIGNADVTVAAPSIAEAETAQHSETIAKRSAPIGFYSWDDSWVGREKLILELSAKLRSECRLLLILGLTGIGKTALAERLAIELQDWFSQDWKNNCKRANFDYQEKVTDFTSVALQWLEEWGQPMAAEDKKPEILLPKLVKYLRENQILLIIDSLEILLTVNEELGTGEFIDPYWEKFFLSLLSAESCQSRVIVTSQDLPVKLLSYRYKNFWYRQVLYGLEEAEQLALFEVSGFDLSSNSVDRSCLLRMGKAYKGHPLALRVIIGEIGSEPYYGNVQAYWNDVGSKIEEVEIALLEAEQGKIEGEEDDWQLHRLTAELRIQVNERLEATFQRLARDIKDAYLLICAASVYRAPVQQEGWLMQLAAFAKRLSGKACSLERQEIALEQLCDRFLVEESVNHNNKRVLGQHNLVRSVALAHHKKLLQRLKDGTF
ncbi:MULTISPECIES: ATP-binding protein [Aerosakkonema]|uniref:ATP-binding protein n=1 Tax=Aerosakkonema TaxID=1246629 RepID=UPI0035B84626